MSEGFEYEPGFFSKGVLGLDSAFNSATMKLARLLDPPPVRPEPVFNEASRLLEDEDGGEEVDMFYGSNCRDDSLEPVVGELERRGYNVERITMSDIGDGKIDGTAAESFRGTPLVYRRKKGFGHPNDRRDRQILSELTELGLRGMDVLPAAEAVPGSDDKRRGKLQLSLAGVKSVKHYRSREAVEQARSMGKTLMEKPNDLSQGQEVRPVHPGEVLDYDEEKLYEELIDHYSDGSPWVERRAVTFTGRSAHRVVEVKDRELKQRRNTDDYRPKNISNGNGTYADLDPEESPFDLEEADTLLRATEALGGGVQGIDYVKNLDTGEIRIIEGNSNVGLSGIRQHSELDIYSELADVLEQEIEGENHRGFSDHLDQYRPKIEDPDVEDRGSAFVNPPASRPASAEGYSATRSASAV